MHTIIRIMRIHHKKFKILSVFFVVILLVLSLFISSFTSISVYAMPFYSLNPQELTVRAQFFTSYPSSSEERKNNIKLAAKSLNNTLVDVGGEFSFNQTVGERTIARGYKSAKIIVGGEFVDGVGGGVCQVSTTLYNAALIAGLEITEYHPHSLSVSYVAPSFDAMVNSGSADLKFINNTDNPIIILVTADDSCITVKIIGEPLKEKYLRKSVITGEITPLPDKIITDEKQEHEELYEGEFLQLKYPKSGLTSEGYLITVKDGKLCEMKKIRSDKYAAIQGIKIGGTKKRLPALEEVPNETNIE